MRIQHNIMAMNAYRNFGNNTSKLSKNLEKLSSGYKINRAGDDAAGLAISEKMRAQITGLQQAQANAKSGINLVQTAEGAMQEVHDMLNRMVKLADQSANGTYDNTTDRDNLQKEVEQLKGEIDRISKAANFNGINLLDGTQSGAKVTANFGSDSTTATMAIDFTGKTGKDLIGGTITIGNTTFTVEKAAAGATNAATAAGTVLTLKETATAGDIASALATAVSTITAKDSTGTDVTMTGSAANGKITYDGPANTAIDPLALPKLGANAGLTLQIGDTSDDFNQLMVGIRDMSTESLFIKNITVANQADAAKAVDAIKNAINMVSSNRGDLGAIQNRLDHTINNLSVMTENIQDAESTIRDTDVAEEMMAYTKNNILIQSAQAMLAQANQVPQGVLQLLQ